MTTSLTRRLFLGAIAAALALTTACGVGTQTGDVALSEEPVTLRFAWWGSDARHALTQEAIDAFEAENPTITVEGEFSDWTGYWDRIATTFAANDAPDVVQMDEYYLRTYADRGALLDLGQASEFLDTSAFSELSLASGQAEGVQYALPTGLSTLAVTANVGLFEQYGIPLPDDTTWTWDDFAAVSARFAQASGGAVAGLPVLGMDVGQMNVWARQHGTSIYDEQGAVSLDPAVLAQWWTYVRGLMDTGATPRAERQAEFMGATLNQSGIVVGEAALQPQYNTQVSSLQGVMPDAELALLQLPRDAGGEGPGTYYKPSMYWSVAASTEHPAEAARFLDFLANSPVAAEILGTDRGIPANPQQLEAIRPSLDGPALAAAEFQERIADVVTEAPPLTPPGASGIEQLSRRYVTEVIFDRLTPEQAAQGFVDELTTSVANAG